MAEQLSLQPIHTLTSLAKLQTSLQVPLQTPGFSNSSLNIFPEGTQGIFGCWGFEHHQSEGWGRCMADRRRWRSGQTSPNITCPELRGLSCPLTLQQRKSLQMLLSPGTDTSQVFPSIWTILSGIPGVTMEGQELHLIFVGPFWEEWDLSLQTSTGSAGR